ncbi:MAG: type I-B CRISPR-associated protein Cas5b [bacterium]
MSFKIYSIDLKARFGFFKKTDTNENIYFTYNWLHKPACLGILGAIAGFGGYSQAYRKEPGKLPEFYEKLMNLRIGLKPISGNINFNGIFEKFVVNYNNAIGYANIGSNLQISEQTVVRPTYRVFLRPEENNFDHAKLIDNLRNGNAEFIPYMGKNDFQACWNNFKEYDAEEGLDESNMTIDTIFSINKGKILLSSLQDFTSITFEKIPVEINRELKSYELVDFVYTSSRIRNFKSLNLNSQLFCKINDGMINVCLF